MKDILKIWCLVLAVGIAIGLSGCRDERGFSTDPNHKLSFSTDTVAFDTLFTEVSSATNMFLVYNRNKADLRIVHAALAGGEDSPYKVNVDGLSGITFSDLAIRGGDSMYVFVEATIDPREQNEPFEVFDALQFTLESGVTQQVVFSASGQDATVMRGMVITGETTLTAARPYLIYDSLRVESGATLRMEPGTQLYLANNVEIQVHGRIEAIGTVEAPIVFRGARTDRMFTYLPYDRLSAQWGGITLHESSTNNIFTHCDIHSGTYGLRARGNDTDESKIEMHNSQIHNVDEDALELTLCKAFFTNCLFTNAGKHCVNILGGEMDFVHCTMANFYPWKSRQGMAVSIANNLAEEANTPYPLLGVNFVNCIITGSKSDELTTNIIEKTDTEDWTEYAKFTFKHSLINSWKTAIEPNEQHFSNIVWENKDNAAYGQGNFRTIDHDNFIYDFHLDALSAARGMGTNEYPNPLPNDKDEQARTTEAIDAGCYQYVSEQ